MGKTLEFGFKGRNDLLKRKGKLPGQQQQQTRTGTPRLRRTGQGPLDKAAASAGTHRQIHGGVDIAGSGRTHTRGGLTTVGDEHGD